MSFRETGRSGLSLQASRPASSAVASGPSRKVISAPPVLRKNKFSGNPSLSTGNATDSICPYGWQLVEYEIDSEKSFSNLTKTYLSFSNTQTSSAYTSGGRSDIALLSFLRSGNYSSNDTTGQSSLINRGARGYYWSRSVSSATNSHYLDFASTYVSPRSSDGRRLGFAVRCLAR